jgi:hypothetical protein
VRLTLSEGAPRGPGWSRRLFPNDRKCFNVARCDLGVLSPDIETGDNQIAIVEAAGLSARQRRDHAGTGADPRLRIADRWDAVRASTGRDQVWTETDEVRHTLETPARFEHDLTIDGVLHPLVEIGE